MTCRFFLNFFTCIGFLLIPITAHTRTLFVSSTPSTLQDHFTSIQQAVDAARPGDIVHIGPGRYRESVQITRSVTGAVPIVLEGSGPDTILDGTAPLQTAGWTRCDEKTYSLPLPRGTHIPLALWEDGERLQEAPFPLTHAGTFAIIDLPSTTSEGRLAIRLHTPSRSPARRRLEIAVRSTLLRAVPGADNVTIRNMTFARSAPSSTEGVIAVSGARHWVLEGLIIRDHGNAAIQGTDAGVHIDTVEIVDAIAPMGRGIALDRPTALIIRNSYIHDNAGPGIALQTGGDATRERWKIVDNIVWANGDANLHIIGAPPIASGDCNDRSRPLLIRGNVIAGAYTTAPDARGGNGLALDPQSALRVRENLFVGNRHALGALHTDHACNPTHHTALAENTLLFSLHHHLDSPLTVPTLQLRNNTFSRGIRYDFLQGLFGRSSQLFADLPAIATTMRAIPKDNIVTLETLVLHGQLPFIFAPPVAQATVLGKEPHLTVVRLSGGEGIAGIRLHVMTAERQRTEATHGRETVRVTVNGRHVPIQALEDQELRGTIALSPWQNWLVMQSPPGVTVDLIEVTPQTPPIVHQQTDVSPPTEG